MDNIKIFENSEFGEIRTVTVDNEPMFCLSDVCRALGLTQPSKVKERLNEKGVNSIPTLTAGGEQKLLYINESNLYKAIFQSRKESAERFTDWVTSEVLPSIRKNGGYIAGQESLSDDELLAKALMVAQNKIAEKDRQIERMKPKEIFADAVSASETSILVGELAKLIKQNGIDIGQNRLFQKLRDMGYLTKKNYPTQKAMDLKLFEIVERTITAANGSTKITQTPKVTGKGQQYFINKFLKSS